MNVLVSGASGFIGSALVRSLENAGHQVIKLRRDSAPGEKPSAIWNPVTREIDLSRAGSLNAVIHLAGETVGCRWTANRKKRIRESRVAGTRLLSETIAGLPEPPRVMVCASGTGFYGDGADRWFDESSAGGAGFLAEVTREWEAAATPAAKRGVRVVYCRFGVVLSPEGGALARMLPAFKAGLGGQLGDGRQYWSWIALADVLRIIELVLESNAFVGPVNVVSPNPVTNGEFTKALAGALRRPAFLDLPRWAVEWIFGEMGRELLLASSRVKPGQLLEHGFTFRWPKLAPALGELLVGQASSLSGTC